MFSKRDMTVAVENKQGKPQKQALRAQKRRGPKRPKKITPEYLHNAGLAYLQRFPASTAHFRQVMHRKIKRSCAFHTDQDEIACVEMLGPVIEKFKRYGLLDDSAYLRGMVTSLRRRGLSVQAIGAKLLSKGYTRAEVNKQVGLFDEEESDGNGELQAALRFIKRKKLGPYRKKEADTKKDLASLARAGFSYDISTQALSQARQNTEI